MRERAIALWVMALVGLGCGDTSEASHEDAALPGDAHAATDGSDASEGPDASDGDLGAPDDATPDTAPPPPPEPAPVAAAEEGVPVVVDHWMVAMLADTDPIASLLDVDVFELPGSGLDQGLYWTQSKTGENGSFNLPGLGQVYYAAAVVSVEEATWAVARLDGVSTVYFGGRRQPGDVYNSKKHRVPLRLEAGENLIVLRGVRRGSAPQVAIELRSHELVFNDVDRIVPDLEVAPPHAQWIGLPILNLTDVPLTGALARVVASEHLEGTETAIPSIGPGASVQIPFALTATDALPTDGTPIVATLRVEAPGLEWSYELETEIPTRELGSGAVVRRTFRSAMDRSAQYYAVREPPAVEEGKQYGLVLSLHGAGVGAKGQAGSYGAKDWAYVVAATNRRPFGFDWEAFGRLDGLEVLDTAQGSLPIDPTRVFVTGHSMGGHGTWQFGTLFPGRFAVVGPSAGWISFASYTGPPFPTGPFGWASLSSNTLNMKTNLANRAVYGIHGTADDNVPVGQLEQMVSELTPIVDDLHTHFEEGAGHWWDGELGVGADCVDWPPLFDLMSERTLDPFELDFHFTSPGAWVSPRHSYVALRSSNTPAQVMTVTSVHDPAAATVTVTATNVRSLSLDGEALAGKGITAALVDGKDVPLAPGPVAVGPQDGKRPSVHGPLIQAFMRPFCLVWADGGPPQYRWYAAHMLSTWNIIGNGTGCAIPYSMLTGELRAAHNIIYLGVPPGDVPLPAGMPMTWDELAVTVDGQDHDAAALGFVFPEGDRLSAVLVTTRTHEYLLYRVVPFSSRFWVPDWLVWADGGLAQAGFFDGDWALDPSLTVP